jgi:hypothetical protein
MWLLPHGSWWRFRCWASFSTCAANDRVKKFSRANKPQILSLIHKYLTEGKPKRSVCKMVAIDMGLTYERIRQVWRSNPCTLVVDNDHVF